jgi:hypothetical protein
MMTTLRARLMVGRAHLQLVGPGRTRTSNRAVMRPLALTI